MRTKEYIKEKLITSDGRPNSAIIRRDWFKESSEYKEILELTEWVNELNPDMKISQRILLIHRNITNFPRCEECNKEFAFTARNKRFCSKKCSCENTKEIRLQNERSRIQKLKKSNKIHSLIYTKDYIKTRFNSKNGNHKREAILNGYYNSVLHYCDIKEITLYAKMYCVLNDITELPICKCGSKISKFIGFEKGFRTYCSNSCKSKYEANNAYKTYFNNSGYTHFCYNPIAFEKMQNNNLKKYGTNSHQSLKWVRDKMERTCLQKYGVRNYAQLGTINSYKWHDYTLPSGKIVRYQGYEGRYIPVLIRKYGEENVCFEKSEVPRIQYTMNDKTHVYFPDFYVPEDNLIIEIKSTYTYNKQLEQNKLKFQAVIEQGFNFKLKIYDR